MILVIFAALASATLLFRAFVESGSAYLGARSDGDRDIVLPLIVAATTALAASVCFALLAIRGSSDLLWNLIALCILLRYANKAFAGRRRATDRGHLGDADADTGPSGR